MIGRFMPEYVSRVGIPGFDAEILDLKPQVDERFKHAVAEVAAELDARAARETSTYVREDLGRQVA